MKKIINIAVIAHVDHGKTTLVDALLKQNHVFRENEEEMQQTQIMDRNELERERGITILAKVCSIHYKDTKINIVDTPGHADFSGEVERTLGMADGALLIVDAQEGPMPQTRFVLKKALEMGLKVVVVINKIDKKLAVPEQALHKVESLFLELAHHDSHLDFPVVYTIGARGAAYHKLPENIETEADISPLLETIVNSIEPAPEKQGPFKMVVTSLDYDPHVGKIVMGRIFQGEVAKGAKIIRTEYPNKVLTVEKLMVYEGLKKVEVTTAQNPEIVAFCGVDEVKIGDTISDPSDTESLTGVSVGEPTIHMSIGPNTSPFAGREGTYVTSRQIEERLEKELEHNLSLRLAKQGNGKYVVSGRGELHLSILLETMRREGYEMEVGKPEVITKIVDGEKQEPVEEVYVLVPQEFVGVITEEFGKRAGKLIEMTPNDKGEVEFVYNIPTRSLIGLRSFLLTATKGTVVYNSVLLGFEKAGKPLSKMRQGALIASEGGSSLAYGLEIAQERGITFIEPGVSVYEGMIIGINSKDDDIAINVCKGKKLTNMRSKSSDGVVMLTPATVLSLEQSIDFLESDELLEITPKSLRLRKKYLSDIDRRRSMRSSN